MNDCPIKLDKKNILLYIVLLLLGSTYLYDLSMDHSIEEMKREQARDQLTEIRHCISITAPKIGQKLSYDACVAKSKTSFTGDAYILDVNTLEFIYDPSKDVPTKEPLYFTKESVGKYFVDWESAMKARDVMLLGKDSRSGINAYYYFNKNPEWLEWIYLPDEYGATHIVVQGVQKKEVMSRYAFGRYTWFGSIFLISVCLIATHNRRRKDDRERDCRNFCPGES